MVSQPRSTTARNLPITVAALIATAFIGGCAATVGAGQPNPAVAAVGPLDISRYSGKWYEIARLPNRFQDHCRGNVTATYRQGQDGRLSVTNRCLDQSGNIDQANGRVRRVDESRAELKVSFLPSLLSQFSWLPFGWGDYWVLDLAPDYSHALVGTPDNRFLWLLSREPAMDEPTYFRLTQKAAAMGFDTNALVRTQQGLEERPVRR